jgi:glycerol-3-phosphate acyltransferase PlsX
MGGDNGPPAAVGGAFQAATVDGVSILLVGQADRVRAELERRGDHGGRIEIVHAEEVVGMGEPASAPLRKKPRSSVRICAELVKQGRAQAMVTAGNTGAAVIAAKMVIGTISGVDRPALAAVVPNAAARTVILDVGATVDSKPAQLRQFAVMGHFYAQEVLRTPSPRVGLLSIGEESVKGTDLTREAFKVLQRTGLSFIGNVEGRDVFNGSVDVVLCDGFVGNAIIKSGESLVELIGALVREELDRSWRTRLAAVLARPAFERLRLRVDWEEYGAAPLLGVDGGCFVAHGRSNAKAVASAIRRAVEFCAADLHLKIRDKVAELHAQEERLLGQPDREEIVAP